MSQSHTIKYKDKNSGIFKDITFKTRSDLKKEDNQKKLKPLFKEQHAIRCLCDTTKELYLYVKESGIVAIYPKSQEHKQSCPFYSERKDFIDEDSAEYKTSIFKEINSTYIAKKTNADAKENCQRLTYYDFCRDIIANASLEAFMYDYGRFNRIYNITFNQFCFSYLKELDNIKFAGGKLSVKGFFQKYTEYRFEYGILRNDINAINVTNDNDIYTLELSKIFYNSQVKKWDTYNKNEQISGKRLRLSKQLVQIWDNYIEPPYFYTAVYYNNVITRFHIMPIYLDDRRIVFVESNYERNYAQKLIEENIVFIKPISNDEVSKIKPEIVNSKCKFIPPIKFHPDFLEFYDNKMIITEVSGFTNSNYINHLDKKMRYYNAYIKNKEEYFDYKCVDGRTLQTIDYKFDPNYWDGEEVVIGGIYSGKKWKEIYKDTLNWYIENKTGYFKDNAIKELNRRDE